MLNNPIHTTRQGYPSVLIDEYYYCVKLAECFMYRVVGKFTKTMPKMELVRKSFIFQNQLIGSVKITHFNSRYVYIDLNNEFDCQTIWTKIRISIERQQMRIHAWTPDFTPKEETPIVPIVVVGPSLPCPCYNKVLLTSFLESIWKVLFFNPIPNPILTRTLTLTISLTLNLNPKPKPLSLTLSLSQTRT